MSGLAGIAPPVCACNRARLQSPPQLRPAAAHRAHGYRHAQAPPAASVVSRQHLRPVYSPPQLPQHLPPPSSQQHPHPLQEQAPLARQLHLRGVVYQALLRQACARERLGLDSVPSESLMRWCGLHSGLKPVQPVQQRSGRRRRRRSGRRGAGDALRVALASSVQDQELERSSSENDGGSREGRKTDAAGSILPTETGGFGGYAGAPPTGVQEKEPLPPELPRYIPVYVMLPLDSVTSVNTLNSPRSLVSALGALNAAGVDGVMVDVWWGVVEAEAPYMYDWSAYRELFDIIHDSGLKLQVVLSFHQCGGNVGDGCYIPLPQWVLECGEANPDIFFTNRDHHRNQEYLTFGVDHEPVLRGRTAMQVYADFMFAFRQAMADYLEGGLITEVEIGLGPAGELRYPSYPETQGWRFPGIGEFQCYDKYLLERLRAVASSVGHPEWGRSGPHDAGRYNDTPENTGFFCRHGSYKTEYGRFFLTWYSDVLKQHCDDLFSAASAVFGGLPLRTAGKIAGVHWWYQSENHAAELAAGYYNTRQINGYLPLVEIFSKHNAVLNFTCFEMKNAEQPLWAMCGPEGLVDQVLFASWAHDVDVCCENALPRYDNGAFNQIIRNALRDSEKQLYRISSFTFLRLCKDLVQEHHWREFIHFVRAMHAGLDRLPHYQMRHRTVKKTYEDNVTYPTKEALRACARGSRSAHADGFVSHRAKRWQGVSHDEGDELYANDGISAFGFIPKELVAASHAEEPSVEEEGVDTAAVVAQLFAQAQASTFVSSMLFALLEESGVERSPVQAGTLAEEAVQLPSVQEDPETDVEDAALHSSDVEVAVESSGPVAQSAPVTGDGSGVAQTATLPENVGPDVETVGREEMLVYVADADDKPVDIPLIQVHDSEPDKVTASEPRSVDGNEDVEDEVTWAEDEDEDTDDWQEEALEELAVSSSAAAKWSWRALLFSMLVCGFIPFKLPSSLVEFLKQ
mmetsp:Transcript_6987/g.25759  ORF Transcript_6987/g.25759 Transcript_6987/m.25759 type:complete len:971 (+) Transcript_6987:311-3223(+)